MTDKLHEWGKESNEEESKSRCDFTLTDSIVDSKYKLTDEVVINVEKQ